MGCVYLDRLHPSERERLALAQEVEPPGRDGEGPELVGAALDELSAFQQAHNLVELGAGVVTRNAVDRQPVMPQAQQSTLA